MPVPNILGLPYNFIFSNKTTSLIGLVRALTTLFGNGARAFRIGKNSVVLTKIGKKIRFMKFLLSD